MLHRFSYNMIVILIMLSMHCVIGDNLTDNFSASAESNETSLVFNNMFMKRSAEIRSLEKENEHLREVVDNLKKDCDARFKKYASEFQKLLNEIRKLEGAQDIQKVESSLQHLYIKTEIFDRARESYKAYINIYRLKYSILLGDVELLRNRQSKYQECRGYGSYINFQPLEGEFGTRSLGAERSNISDGYEDIATLVYERSKVLLDIKKEQATFKNMELKNFIAYYSAYCERRITNIKNITDKLRKYPMEALFLVKLMKEVERLTHGLNLKFLEIKKLKKELNTLIPQILDLQREYDSFSDQTNCFLKMSQWKIDQSVTKIDELADKVESFMKERVEENGENGRPVDVEPTEEKPSEIDLELTEAGNGASSNMVETETVLPIVTANSK